jgi:hypothetical protein
MRNEREDQDIQKTLPGGSGGQVRSGQVEHCSEGAVLDRRAVCSVGWGTSRCPVVVSLLALPLPA